MSARRVAEDPEREHRITYEAVVDCYNETERAMGWYYYLERALCFPFKARCTATRSASPLKVGEVVHVVRLAPEDECMSEVLVQIEFEETTLAVPLSQLACMTRRRSTLRGVGDWQYWVNRGYTY